MGLWRLTYREARSRERANLKRSPFVANSEDLPLTTDRLKRNLRGDQNIFIGNQSTRIGKATSSTMRTKSARMKGKMPRTTVVCVNPGCVA